MERFQEAGGEGKPRLGQLHVCWAASADTARRVAHAVWPNAGLAGPLTQELALPGHFELAAEPLRIDDVARSVVCGPDPELHVAAIRRFEDAGFEQLAVHQVGPDQEGFFRFYEREILPLTVEV